MNGARVVRAPLVITSVRDGTRIRLVERGTDDKGAWLWLMDLAQETVNGKRRESYAPWFPSRS